MSQKIYLAVYDNQSFESGMIFEGIYSMPEDQTDEQNDEAIRQMIAKQWDIKDVSKDDRIKKLRIVPQNTMVMRKIAFI